MPPALLSSLLALESSLGSPRIVPQADRRRVGGRRLAWRGGRRVSDFSQFANLTWVGSLPRDRHVLEPGESTAEGFLH